MVERSTGAQPSGPRAAEPHDGGEVTLRQLYLTFKAGLWLIVVVGLVCGVAAFLIAGAVPLLCALVLGASLAHRQELRLRVDLRRPRRLLTVVRRTPLVE